MADPVIVNKARLAHWLGISLPTLSAWMLRYGADFPVVERGSNGRDYRFDAQEVSDFLRARKAEMAAEQDQRRAERDEQLAQLRLPIDLPGVEPPPPANSAKDAIEGWKLRRIEREEAERAGALLPAEDTKRAMRAAFARLSREMHALIRQIAREEGWPDPKLREMEKRLADRQRAAVAALAAELSDADAIAS